MAKLGRTLMANKAESFDLILKSGGSSTLLAISHYKNFKKKSFSGTQIQTLTVYGPLLNKETYKGAIYKNRQVNEIKHVTKIKTVLYLSPVKEAKTQTNQEYY